MWQIAGMQTFTEKKLPILFSRGVAFCARRSPAHLTPHVALKCAQIQPDASARDWYFTRNPAKTEALWPKTLPS